MTPEEQVARIRKEMAVQAPQAHALFKVLEEGDDDTAKHQAVEAIDLTRRSYALAPKVPWRSLHELVGPVLPDALWLIGAQTGQGKTTLLMNWLSRMGEATAYVLPLENPPAKMRLLWAALSLKLDPALVLENRWRELPEDAERMVQAHVAEQVEYAGNVVFSEVPYLSPENLKEAFQDAAHARADVIFIDHVHRMTESSYRGMSMVGKLLSRCIREYGIPVVGTAQFNQGVERSPFQGFREPALADLYMGQVLAHEAHVITGLFRPLLPMTKEEQAEVRERRTKAWRFSKPNVVGVHCMKHRVRGTKAEGHTVELRYEEGRIVE
jgi:replicative DNA helicase